ncbi:MAG: hypothetical protein HY272_11215 [Gammaproteobacteria bacterium]|nr:hypothetical protein [Gammaproteobacteria bacterium]
MSSVNTSIRGNLEPSPAKTTRNSSDGKTRASFTGTLIFFLLVTILLYDGWLNRFNKDITAEHGIGYWLGIIGGSLMLLLLLYPLRKRWGAMRKLGAVKHWFRFHMALGVLGPTAILYHSNFQLGALNSNIALSCMLIVASSGLLGRYFYAKIHHGLYGRQATLEELNAALSAQENILLGDSAVATRMSERLARYHSLAQPPSSLAQSLARVLALAIHTRSDYWRIRRGYSRELRRHLADYFSAIRHVAEYSLYTRLFALWHILHLPLFVMMLITGIVHVIAVHVY